MNKLTLWKNAMMAAALSVAIATASAADREVAQLVLINGDAVVSKGAQYVSATEGMALAIGERVMSLAASSVVLQFNDGCRYVLEANQLLTIEDESPCALGYFSKMQPGTVPAAPTPAPVVPVAAAGAVGLGWVPLAAVGVIAVPGATLDTGNRRAISP